MSGGSYDYFYRKLEDFAASINATTPERAAFKAHCQKVADAAHDIEWVDSCDYAKGDENDAIMRCVTPGDIVATAAEKAERVLEELKAILERVKR